MKIIVRGTLEQKVVVDPVHVIDELRDKEIHREVRVYEKDGKYYKEWDTPAGGHSHEVKEEISKELFAYLESLANVKKYLSKK